MTEMAHLFSKAKASLTSRYETFLIHQRANWKHHRSQALNLGHPDAVIWIFGCQRSGTTFLENTFRHDLDSVVFGEFSDLTIGPGKSVLTDLETVRGIVLSQNAKYAVIRPLFESDRAAELIDLFPNSVGVWLFRDCPHVVDSMIRKWGDRFFEVSKQVESQDGIWRLEQSINETMAQVKNQFSVDMTAELYARYWLLRNQIPFVFSLPEDQRFLFVSYKQLVSDPQSCIRRILHRVGMDGPWRDFRNRAQTAGLDYPVQAKISENILVECGQAYCRLVEVSQTNL